MKTIPTDLETEIIALIQGEVKMLPDVISQAKIYDLVATTYYLSLPNPHLLSKFYNEVISDELTLNFLFSLAIKSYYLISNYVVEGNKKNMVDVVIEKIADSFSSIIIADANFQIASKSINEQSIYNRDLIIKMLSNEKWILSLCLLHLYGVKTDIFHSLRETAAKAKPAVNS